MSEATSSSPPATEQSAAKDTVLTVTEGGWKWR